LIKKATKKDIKKIHYIINESNKEAFQKIIPAEYFKTPVLTLKELIDEFEKMTFYTYEHNNKSVGVSALKFLDTETASINWVYVLPKYQRKGVGTALINHLENIAKKKGVIKLQLLTDENAIWAIKFYEKLEYKPVERINRPWGFDIKMIKNL
jgi:N-acetylglutamate synthase-like GNAT family acetyltransferase